VAKLTNLFIFFIFISQCFAADEVVLPLNESVTAERIGPETQVTLESHYSVRIINQDDLSNLDNWSASARLVDESNNPLSKHTYRISRRFLYKATSLKLEVPVEGYDVTQGKLNYPAKGRFVILSKGDKDGLKYFLALRVNENGSVIAADGNIVDSDVRSNLIIFEQDKFDAAIIESEISKIARANETIEEHVDAVCSSCLVEQSIEDAVQEALELDARTTTPLKLEVTPEVKPEEKPEEKPVVKPEVQAVTGGLRSSLRPRLRPKNLDTRTMEERCREAGTWECLKLNLDIWASDGYKSCRNKVLAHEKQFNQTWKNDSISKRAENINNGMAGSLAKIEAHANSIGKNNKQSSSYANMQNPHYQDPLLNSNIATCIVFQETKGTLQPQKVNYNFCKIDSKTWSTAIGLGQVTRSTVRSMRSNDGVNLLPITTLDNNPFRNKTGTEVHAALADNTELQYEVILRMVNYNIKLVRFQRNIYATKNCNGNKNCIDLKAKLAEIETDEEILKRAVEVYDQDSKSQYLTNVFNKCIPCMDNLTEGENPIKCHNQMD
jgi:hypothetical protein